MKHLTILSLCDYTGNWAAPYREAGYSVRLVDAKHGDDVRSLPYIEGGVHGILAAPPCTEFSGSGAQYWPEKDADGRTLAALSIVHACLALVAIYRPAWWALENPVGRLNRWIGPPTFTFDPCDFGDAYTKRTHLWGRFVAPLPLFIGGHQSVEPERVCSQGSWLMKLGGKSERTKELRSATPMGFARAFFAANP